MIKAEPLKSKTKTWYNSTMNNWFTKSDIKSAVEWLKNELSDFESDGRFFINSKIDEAFEDVIE